jgi:phage virion morphogenesis protein
MAGASIAIHTNWEDRELREAFKRLERAAGDLEPALRDFGESWLNNARARFEAEQAPDGTPWAPLSERYKRRKKRNRDRVLMLRGHLYGTLNYQVSSTEVAIGSPLIYAAPHQYGDERRGIPARPFLGLSEADRSELLSILDDHLRRALRG